MDYLAKKADSGEVVDLQELFYKYTLGKLFIASSSSLGKKNLPYLPPYPILTISSPPPRSSM